MAREIKFRAWWKEAKLMADVEVWREDDIVIIVPVVSSIPGHKFERQLLDEGEYNLMQYTGLEDKNGKEIYFGDILDYEDVHTEKGVHYIGEVIETMNNGAGVNIDNVISDLWEDEDVHIFEVIGNIYENPELLKD